MRTIEINGQDFNSLDGFYASLEKYLIDGECPWEQNLDSLDEIVYTNFNYTDDKNNDVTKIVWYNFDKSRIDLSVIKNGKPVIEVLEEMFYSNPKIQFDKN